MDMILLLLMIVLYTYVSCATIEILSPAANDRIFVDADGTTADVSVQTNIITRDSLEGYVLCMLLKDLNEMNIEISSCFPLATPHVVFQKLPVGKYEVTAFYQLSTAPTQDIVLNSSVIRHFEVATINFVKPEIVATQENLEFVIAPFATSTHATIPYTVMNLMDKNSLNEYAACITLTEFQNILFDNACVPIENEDSSIILYNLHHGKFNWKIQMVRKLPSKQELVNAVSGTVLVKHLNESMPQIIPQHDTVDIAVDETTNVGSQSVEFHIVGNKLAIDNVIPCLQISNYITDEVLLPLQLLLPHQRILSLTGIPAGKHSARMSLCVKDLRGNIYEYEETRKLIELDARYPVEFVPSYDWQPLKAYHTIPASVETSLPIGGEQRVKQVRIPNPWRLQLLMPKPCKYFLRLDVYRDTQLEQIRNAAASKCHVPSQCLDLLLDDISVFNPHVHSHRQSAGNHDTIGGEFTEPIQQFENVDNTVVETVESLNVFNRNKELRYNFHLDECKLQE